MSKRTDFGKHHIVDFFGCDPDALKHVESVREAFLRAARESHATLLEHAFHQFSPFGVSGVVLIAESHFAIHTWPEDAFAGVDIFTCGEEMDADVAIEVIRKALRATEVRRKILVRGRIESS